MKLVETAERAKAEKLGRPMSRPLLWTLAALGLALLVAAIGLWARHGAAVFFDLVSAGFAYCF